MKKSDGITQSYNFSHFSSSLLYFCVNAAFYATSTQVCYFHSVVGAPCSFLRFRLVTLTWNSARSITEPLVSWWCIDVTLSNDKKQKWRTNKESSILNVSFLCAFVLSSTISPARIMMKTRMCGEVKCVRNWRDAIRR